MSAVSIQVADEADSERIVNLIENHQTFLYQCTLFTKMNG